MLSRVYSKVFDFAKTKPVKLWGITWLATVIVAFASILGGTVPLFGVVAEILMQTAILIICVKAIRGEEFSSGNLFDKYKSWADAWRVLGGNLWAALFIFLWSLIPIVGPIFAIIRTYEYRLVPYILVNEPEVSIKDARLLSKERTNGYKWDMFSCDIVWVCAFVLAEVIIMLLSNIPIIGGLFMLIGILLIGVVILLAPVIVNLINAECYEEICASK